MLFSRVALIVSVLCASGLAAPVGGTTNTDSEVTQPASDSNSATQLYSATHSNSATQSDLATHQHAAMTETNTNAGLTQQPADDSTAKHPNLATHQQHAAVAPFKLTESNGYWIASSASEHSKNTKVDGHHIYIENGQIVSADATLVSMIEKDPSVLCKTFWKENSDQAHPRDKVVPNQLHIKSLKSGAFTFTFNRAVGDQPGTVWLHAGSLMVALKKTQ